MPKRKKSPELDRHLALQSFFLRRLGLGGLDDVTQLLSADGLEGYSAEGTTKFLEELFVRFTPGSLTTDDLRRYDLSIVSITEKLNRRRTSAPIVWKYFQYLTLLFVEMYLDAYFRDRDHLLADLNDAIRDLNATGQAVTLPEYQHSDTNRLSIGLATGGGKTLLLHANLMQFRNYLQMWDRAANFNRTVVLTTSETLSRQHLDDLRLSGISAEMFDKEGDTLFRGEVVDVIDIHKLRDEPGDKTVAVESFETNNLVFIDEGHRGGDDWRSRRDQLTSDGFAFEYSATFAQAIKTSDSAELFADYARSIVLDYPYRRFYFDGYGKDYRILNLHDDKDPDHRRKYLIGCLLSYFQQLELFDDLGSSISRFNIERPLWIFLGTSVTRSARKDVTDAVEILQFLQDFARDSRCSSTIDELLSGRLAMVDEDGRDVFGGAFPYLHRLGLDGAALYDRILAKVFNSAAPGDLRLEDLRGTDGEIALRVGGSKPFGVTQVGDKAGLLKLAESVGFTVDEGALSESLFDSINTPRSAIQILIGAKKFAEGWNSWRVSTIGLMNVGRGEGAQIIQLFGRGVRLKGIDFGLKRSRVLNLPTRPEFIDLLETVNVIGVRSDYMKQFEAYLIEEGLPATGAPATFVLPTTKTAPPKLQVPRIASADRYERSGVTTELDLTDDPRIKVVLDWYPKVSALSSIASGSPTGDKQTGHLQPGHLAMLDIRRLTADLVRYKKHRNYRNLVVSQRAVRRLLESHAWYELRVPPRDLELASLERHEQWQEIAKTLLTKYCDRFYRFRVQEWEATRFRLVGLTKEDANYIDSWEITVDSSDTPLISLLQKFSTKSVPSIDIDKCSVFDVAGHLYNPIVYSARQSVKVTPVALNQGERQFVRDFDAYLKSSPALLHGVDVYMLRNRSRGRGIGFFEASMFYPDFILWFVGPTPMRVAFVDPKGIVHEGPDQPKLTFYATIKDLEARLDGKVSLSSFIVSGTPLAKVPWKPAAWSSKDFDDRNILFQESPAYISRLVEKALA